MARSLTIMAAMLAICLLAASSLASSHPGIFASALVKVESDGRLVVTLRHDAVAFALDTPSMKVADDAMNALVNGPDADLKAAFDDARARYEAQFAVEADGRPVTFTIKAAPTAEDVRAWQRGQEHPLLPVRLDLITESRFPSDAASFALRFPENLGDVIITVDRPGLEPVAVPLRGGELSPAFELPKLTQRTAADPADAGIAASGHVGDASEDDSASGSPRSTELARVAKGPASSAPRTPADSISNWQVTIRYIRQGFLHIVPQGLDHIVFVLGLYLLSPSIRALLIQVTAFTLAHTVTLALTVLGYISIPGSIVEPIIAASIAFVAIENLFTKKVHPWRPALVFSFGLVHGVGWAGALAELGLPEGKLANALISFNVGVELGQLSVVAAALLLVGWIRHKPWYRARITIPASIGIAAIALYWTVERIFA